MKQLGSGFRGLLDPDSDFWLDVDLMNMNPKHCYNKKIVSVYLSSSASITVTMSTILIFYVNK